MDMYIIIIINFKYNIKIFWKIYMYKVIFFYIRIIKFMFIIKLIIF